MSTRSSKAAPRRKLDANQLAKSIMAQATGEAPKVKMATPKQIAGQKGGLKGGKARMNAMNAEERAKLSALGVAARNTPASSGAGVSKVTKNSR